MVKNIWKSYIWTADKDVNESDPRSNVHYLGSSENKSLRLYPQFKYMKKRKSIKKRFSFAKRKIQLYRGTDA